MNDDENTRLESAIEAISEEHHQKLGAMLPKIIPSINAELASAGVDAEVHRIEFRRRLRGSVCVPDGHGGWTCT